MPKVRVHNLTVSLDGYAAGSNPVSDHATCCDGSCLNTWVTSTRAYREQRHLDGGDLGIDDTMMARATEGIGATIIGRRLFGPADGSLAGPWEDLTWPGRWGGEPPFRQPVFVLTHHPREPLEAGGGTTFTFVTDGIEAALERALAAAGGADVRVGGGPATIRQFLEAGLVDELHLVITPMVLEGGHRFLKGARTVAEGYACVEYLESRNVAHATYVREPR
jgi:dihydrofolate reductase